MLVILQVNPVMASNPSRRFTITAVQENARRDSEKSENENFNTRVRLHDASTPISAVSADQDQRNVSPTSNGASTSAGDPQISTPGVQSSNSSDGLGSQERPRHCYSVHDTPTSPYLSDVVLEQQLSKDYINVSPQVEVLQPGSHGIKQVEDHSSNNTSGMYITFHHC